MKTPGTYAIDIYFDDFWETPAAVIGMYPVFSDVDGGMWNHVNPISDVTVHELATDSEGY